MNIPVLDEAQAKTQAQGIARPAWLLRIEGATLLIAAVWLYAIYSGNWLLFALLLLAPDLSALGYFAGVRLGATTYNLAHTLIWPTILAALAFSQANVFLIGLALIWFAHIGMDRMLGYGLKYPTAFKDTHLDRI